MKFEVVHHLSDRVDICHGNDNLLSYVYNPDVPDSEAPRPIFHPLRTLAGNVVSGFRPHDHYWHHGLSMTCAALSGQNFWGGPTYVRSKGYVDMPNRGRQLCRKLDNIIQSEDAVTIRHGLDWYSSDDQHWITEQRAWRLKLGTLDKSYQLDISLELTNISGQELNFGSPTTEGRPNAGYGGLFWRGPRDFTDGQVVDSQGRTDAETIMGKSARWLAYSSKHDGSHCQSTLVFIDHPENPRYPNKWFVRTAKFPVASFAFVFDEVYPLADKATLKLGYRLLIIDGRASVEQIEQAAGEFQNHPRLATIQ